MKKYTAGNFEQVRLALCGRKVKMVTTKLAHQNACRHQCKMKGTRKKKSTY